MLFRGNTMKQEVVIFIPPKKGQGYLMSPWPPLSGISGLSFDSPFLSPLFFSFFFFFFFFLCLVLLHSLSGHFSANGPFSWLFYPEDSLTLFSKRVRLFDIVLVGQLGDDSLCVIFAGCCHMALVFGHPCIYRILTFFLLLLSIKKIWYW